MEANNVVVRRFSNWGILLFSMLLALFLAAFMTQGLSAQTAVDENGPAPTSEAAVDGEESQASALEATTALTATTTPSQTEEVTAPGTVTTSLASTPTTPLLPANGTTVTLFLPMIYQPLPVLAIGATRPNSQNEWQVYWEDLGEGVTYQLQESQKANFSVLLSDQVVSEASFDVARAATPYSSYYYRVRPIRGASIGDWSDTATVIGAYYDNFSNSSTGWEMRRTTYLEKTVSWYGKGSNAGNFIIVVDDRWDWMIASPLQKAPTVPYVIEYRSRVHDASNLVSGGAVVGGDWNRAACPEFGNVYKTDNCFNHFYNFNYIYYGKMKLLFEQVDRLTWCPSCEGSPLKRRGDESNWKEIDPILGGSAAEEWHTYRIVVREDGLRLTIDGNYKGRFGTPDYVHDPYFGVFASTDEYKPSIWFFDYFKVTPLDS